MDKTKDIFEYEDNFAKYKHIESKLLIGNINDCKNPVISIVMPIFTAPMRYFKIALESAINQDLKEEYEIVVVDNTPYNEEKTDAQKYIESLKQPNIFYYRNLENIGMMPNWNRCVELARSPYITFLHDDDELLPNCLSKLLEVREKTNYSWIAVRYNDMDTEGNIIRKKGERKAILPFFVQKEYHKLTKWDYYLQNAGSGVGCLLERNKVIKLGGYDQRYYPVGDAAFYVVYNFNFGGGYIEAALYNRRFGIGDTKAVWKTFADSYAYLRQCMMKRLPLPNFILNVLRKAYYDFFVWYNAYANGKVATKDDYYKMVPLKSRVLFQCSRRLLEIKQFRFSLTGWK